MHITLDSSKGPIVLVDTSYFVFYRYYATFNWYKKQATTQVEASQIMNDPVFMDKFTKMFSNALTDIVKTYKVTHASNLVLARDCSRDSIWRHQHYSAYKATRDEKSNTFNKDVFSYAFSTLLPSLQDKMGFQSIGHRKLEADDVIALITKRLLNTSTAVNIVIITNDNDYIQLLDHEALTEGGTHSLRIVNLQQKDICARVGCSPKQYIIVKKLIGDKSDNIPAIVKKCGEKTALKLANNRTMFDNLMATDENARSQYILNELLMDFDKIPLLHQEELLQYVDII